MNTKLLTTNLRAILVIGIFLPFFGAFAQPVITLIGNSTVYTEVGKPYVSLGATAYDTIDGNITSSITVISDVETSFAGICTETFSVTNSRNQKSSVSRIVIVRNDLTPPVLTLIGPDTLFIEASRDNSNFNDPGATAIDNKSPFNLTSNIVVYGKVNTRRVGIYPLTYFVRDLSNNFDSAIRVVIVRDTKKPEWINATTPHYLPFGKPFIDSVDIVDAYDNSINFLVQIPVGGIVNVNKSGVYNYVYIAEADSSGNVPDTLFMTYIVGAKVSVESNTFSHIKVFPTITSDILNIQLTEGTDALKFQIFDINGKCISADTNNTGGVFTINVSAFPSGMYLLQLEIAGNLMVYKFIKE